MNPPAHDYVREADPLVPAPVGGRAGRRSGPSSSTPEQDADAAANDWQIILQLRTLFERSPALICSLLEGCGGRQLAKHTGAVMAAAREALAARPDSVELHCHAARAAAQTGRLHEADTWLQRVLELNPDHVEALTLLADVCKALNKPKRAGAYLRRALAVGAGSPGCSRQERK